ncbi:CIC_collapsed_G0037380.mRNA.1.CDS.1 [Saccharomyces cerevisiae]|nr:CIC_collapsed_G0037380.mRNA.1.CDS.1 [Saccharomyces cerevisiae]
MQVHNRWTNLSKSTLLASMDTLEPTAVDTHTWRNFEYQRRKRTEYEGYLKRNRLDMGQWIRYAQFEIEPTRHGGAPDLSLKEHY